MNMNIIYVQLEQICHLVETWPSIYTQRIHTHYLNLNHKKSKFERFTQKSNVFVVGTSKNSCSFI